MHHEIKLFLRPIPCFVLRLSFLTLHLFIKKGYSGENIFNKSHVEILIKKGELYFHVNIVRLHLINKMIRNI